MLIVICIDSVTSHEEDTGKNMFFENLGDIILKNLYETHLESQLLKTNEIEMIEFETHFKAVLPNSLHHYLLQISQERNPLRGYFCKDFAKKRNLQIKKRLEKGNVFYEFSKNEPI